MRKHAFVALAALAAAALAGSGAHGQVFTPSFMGPHTSSDVGLYVSDGPGDLAIEGIWRRGRGYDLGIRAGYADVADGSLLVGIETRSPVVLAGAPIGLAFTAAAQGVIGDLNGLGGAIGFTAGQAFTPPQANFTLTPYIHPRFVVYTIENDTDDDDLETDIHADLGLDVAFRSNVSLRFGFGLAGSQADWGVGVAWRQ